MTDQEINIAIAEACGAKRSMEKQQPHRYVWDFGDGVTMCACDLPNYSTDLNAMHEAEKVLYAMQDWRITRRYMRNISPHIHSDESMDGDDWMLVNSEARQRAEAFLRTFGLWTSN